MASANLTTAKKDLSVDKKRKILLVDDTLTTLNQLKNLLEEVGGYNILTATTTSDALSTVDSNPDLMLVVTDLVLPEHFGLTAEGEAGMRLLDSLRSKLPGLPIIVISAHLEPFAKDLLRLGASTVISKLNIRFADEVLSYIPKALEEYETRARRERDEAAMRESIRRVVIEEIERYTPIKERTIHIPKEGQYELIKPLIGYIKDIEGQLARFPFAKNVFLMMKFRESNRELSEYIVENLSKHGLRCVRADHEDWNITKDVYNPIAVLYCCKYGIALFDEPEDQQAYSPNVAYELGMMHYQNKPCLILRHNSLPAVPFDLIKNLYVTYERDLQVKQIIASWLNQLFQTKDSRSSDMA